jgi:hypothetical protein
MKRIKIFILTAVLMAFTISGFSADQRIQYNEYMVGANHPTETDTLNRLSQVEHNTDGTHKAITNTAAGLTAQYVDWSASSGGTSIKNKPTISGSNTGDQNTFTSIPVSGQTTVTAESATQALTFVAGSNVTITTDNSAKSVTFASTAGGATKATAAEIATGTDDAKFATALAIKNSHNVPSVAPGTIGNLMTSNGTDWISSAAGAVPVKASGAELATGSDDAKFATAKAIKDSHNVPSVAPSTTGNVMTSNGTDWTSATPTAVPVKASGSEITAGTDDAKFATAKSLRDADVGMWKSTTGTFTARPPSTSTITMTTDLTATMKVGLPLRYTWNSNTYYGRVAAIASNLLSVNGAPLSTSYDVTALSYGMPSMVRQVNVIIPGSYEDASNTALIASDLKSSLLWQLPVSYLVYFSVYSNTHDSHATHGQASVRINNTEVNTTAGGETIAANATWYPTVVNIATAAYDINPGESIEVTAVKGGTGDAADLTVSMIFVTP